MYYISVDVKVVANVNDKHTYINIKIKRICRKKHMSMVMAFYECVVAV